MKFRKLKEYLNRKNITFKMTDSKKINVDEAEIQKFDSMAKEWWDPHGPMKPMKVDPKKEPRQYNTMFIMLFPPSLPMISSWIKPIGCP